MNARSRLSTSRHISKQQSDRAREILSNEQIDICAYLFKVCISLQKEMLDPRSITCFFDVDSGTLSHWKSGIIAEIIQIRTEEICRAATTDRGRIIVSFHRSETAWTLMIVDEDVRTLDSEELDNCTTVRELAFALGAVCRNRLSANGSILTVVLSKSVQENARGPNTLSKGSSLLMIEDHTESGTHQSISSHGEI